MKKNQLKSGSIHYVDFGEPSTHLIAGLRPALVISTSRRIVLVIPITGNRTGTVLEDEIPIPAGTGGLKLDSKLKTDQIQSVDITQIKTQIGQFPSKLLLQIIRYIEYRMLIPLITSNDDNSTTS